MKTFPVISTVLILFLLVVVTSAATPTVSLDGVRDGEYGSTLASDPSGDLLSPGPADWTGTAWADQTNIYCTNDSSNLYVYVDLDDYAQNVSSGQIGLLIGTTVGGGAVDPWGNAITFSHAPDYVIRGNIPGIDPDPMIDNGHTELLTWNGSGWSGFGTNWGGLVGGAQIGSNIAYANNQGVEFAIPLSAIGSAAGDTISLEFFATQGGATKGAYDTVPSDSQGSTSDGDDGWDDPTDLSQWATCVTEDEITPSPTPPPIPVWDYPTRTTLVHLFEWRWTDIATECEKWLGPKGYSAVQVSPPNEHRVIDSADYPWWQRYQPTSYLIESRSGIRAEFADMVQRCNAVGVEIYVDAVINHTSGLDMFASTTGSAGTMITDLGGTADYPTDPGLYSSHVAPAPDHFNYDICSTGIVDWCDRWEVTHCELLGLDDLDTADNYVQTEIATYLNDLVGLGVTGFRIDAAKHIPEAELGTILGMVTGSPTVFQEVIQDAGCGFDGSTYTAYGDVTEFGYGYQLASAFNTNNLASLNGIESGMLDSAESVIFADNHDTQRAHLADSLVMTYHRGNAYTLSNIFMLAYPYSTPKVMSSYEFDAGSADAGPPSSSPGVTEIIQVGSGTHDLKCDYVDSANEWVCEHRWLPIANMVGFRNFTDGEALANWRQDSNNRIAFSRGTKGFVAFNNEGGNWSTTFQTGLPAGTYCNITVADIVVGGCKRIADAGEGPTTFTVDGSGNATIDIPAYRAVAGHIGEPSVPTATRLLQPNAQTSGGAIWLVSLALIGLLLVGVWGYAFVRGDRSR